MMLALALAAFPACSGGSSKGATSSSSASASTASSTTTSTSSTTSTTVKPEDEVKAAYLRYWQVVDSTVEPDDPALLDVAIDPVLGFLRDDLATDKAKGVRTQLPKDPALNSHRLDSLALLGESATVRDCFVDGRLAVGTNGEVINDAVVTKNIEATITRQTGRWRVSSVSVVSRSDGVSGCAA